MHKQFKTSKAAVFCRVFGSMPTSWPLGHVGDMRITGVDAQPRPESCWAQGWSFLFVRPKLMQAFPFCCFAPLPSNFYNPLPDSEDSQMIPLQFVALLSFCPCPLHVFFFLALVHPLYLYLLRASLVISCPLSQDSKCTVPDATTAAVAAMTTGLSGSERNSWLSLLSTPNCSRTPKAHRFQ